MQFKEKINVNTTIKCQVAILLAYKLQYGVGVQYIYSTCGESSTLIQGSILGTICTYSYHSCAVVRPGVKRDLHIDLIWAY